MMSTFPRALLFFVATPAFAQVTETCSSVWPRAASLPATIPIKLRNNHVAVPVCRGDKPLEFLLDTGAGMSIYDLEIAKGFGAGIRSSFRANGAGAGTVAAAQIDRDSVFIPGASIKVPISVAMDFRPVGAPDGSVIEGILGADFIARYIVAIDYRKLEMRLYDRATFKYDGPGTVVPFRIVGAFIRVNADVLLADGARVPGDFVVDVGSSLALALAKPFVVQNRLKERVGPTVRRPAGRGVGGTTVADVGRVAKLSIGGVDVPRPITYLYGDSAGVFSSGGLGDGNIGSDILRRFTVYFDYAARRMIFELHEGTAEPFETDMSGLQMVATPNEQSLTAEFVLPSSPAGEAGLQKGDVITAVDGAAVAAPSLESLRKRFRREGENVAVTVRRGGSEMIIRFTTRRLV